MHKKRKEQISKEMQNIIDAITIYCEKHKGNVSFIGSFVAYDKSDEVIDDRLFSYGKKEVLKEQLYSLAKEIVDSEKEFVNI